MVTLIPENDNPRRKDIDAYICEMLASNSHNFLMLMYTVGEIRNKSDAGALLHPAEEYFLNSFNNSVKNMSLEDLQSLDQRCNFDKAYNDL